MNVPYAIVKESYLITVIGIIAELQHTQNGLPKGTLLTDNSSNLSWEVSGRILFTDETNMHRTFPNENHNFIHPSFTFNSYQLFMQKIKEKENENIFQYLLKPLAHDKKPAKAEMLLINFP